MFAKNRDGSAKLLRINSVSGVCYVIAFIMSNTFGDVLIGRNSHRRCSVKKGVLRNFAKFTGKHLCQRLFFNKVAGLGLNCGKVVGKRLMNLFVKGKLKLLGTGNLKSIYHNYCYYN